MKDITYITTSRAQPEATTPTHININPRNEAHALRVHLLHQLARFQSNAILIRHQDAYGEATAAQYLHDYAQQIATAAADLPTGTQEPRP